MYKERERERERERYIDDQLAPTAEPGEVTAVLKLEVEIALLQLAAVGASVDVRVCEVSVVEVTSKRSRKRRCMAFLKLIMQGNPVPATLLVQPCKRLCGSLWCRAMLARSPARDTPQSGFHRTRLWPG